MQAAAVGFRDEIPERLAYGGGFRAAFEVGTVEKLDDGFADLAAVSHVGCWSGC